MLVTPLNILGLYGLNLSSKFFVMDDFGNIIQSRIPHDFWDVKYEAILSV